MAQFDVYRNPSKATKKHYPYILDIQHSVISDLSTRLVIPLGRLESFDGRNMKTLAPVIDYEGESLVLLTPQLASVPASTLRAPVGSLAHFRNQIVAAIDFAITGI